MLGHDGATVIPLPNGALARRRDEGGSTVAAVTFGGRGPTADHYVQGAMAVTHAQEKVELAVAHTKDTYHDLKTAYTASVASLPTFQLSCMRKCTEADVQTIITQRVPQYIECPTCLYKGLSETR